MKRAGALLLALAACSEAPAPPQPRPSPAAPAIATAPPPPAGAVPGGLPAPELENVGTALGGWQRRGDRALFAAPDGTALFALSCDKPARRVVFARLSDRRAPGRLRLVTATAAASVSARIDPGPPRAIVGDLGADDLFLTALAASDDRFGVRIDDEPTLALLVDRLVQGVIEDCRRPVG